MIEVGIIIIIFLIIIADKCEDKRNQKLLQKLDEIRCGLIDIEEEIKRT